MKKQDEIRNKINAMAKEKTPFLFAIDFEMNNGFVLENPLSQSEILWKVNQYSNINSIHSKNIKLMQNPICYDEYKAKFDIVHKGLYCGNSFLTNLTTATEIDINCDLSDIAQCANSPFILCIPDQFVCFSPEIFITIENGKISSNPMKGTIDANTPNAAEKILSDYKESAEHFTIVDLIRSDLGRVSSEVKVDRLRYIDEIKNSKGNLLQVSSQISGKILPEYENALGDLLFELLPAGSISGAPKPATVSIIAEAEKEKRGYYTGVFGYFDGENLYSAVMIRFIEKKGEKYFFRSGGGITINSDSKDEYNETIAKVYLPFTSNNYIESIKIENGKVYNLPLHLTRIKRSIGEQLDLRLSLPEELIDKIVKWRIVYNGDGIIEESYSEYNKKEIRTLKVVEYNSISYEFKYENREVLNQLYENREHCDDIIIIKNGLVTDSSFCNIIFEDYSGQLFTPKQPLLHGTKRAELVAKNAISEKDIYAQDIKNYKNIILINAMTEYSLPTEAIFFD